MGLFCCECVTYLVPCEILCSFQRRNYEPLITAPEYPVGAVIWVQVVVVDGRQLQLERMLLVVGEPLLVAGNRNVVPDVIDDRHIIYHAGHVGGTASSYISVLFLLLILTFSFIPTTQSSPCSQTTLAPIAQQYRRKATHAAVHTDSKSIPDASTTQIQQCRPQNI